MKVVVFKNFMYQTHVFSYNENAVNKQISISDNVLDDNAHVMQVEKLILKISAIPDDLYKQPVEIDIDGSTFEFIKQNGIISIN